MKKLLLLGLAFCLAGCGARWSDAQHAEVAARATAIGSSAQAARAGGASASPIEASGGLSADGGPASPVTTPRAVAGATTRATLPCAAASSAPGVTSSTITIGSISSLSGPVPGLGTPSAAAVRAYVAYRNATGGVCGRQLALSAADDHSDSAQYRSELVELNPKVIGFAGGLSLGDDGSADTIRDGKIPMIESRAADGVEGQPTVFELNPPFADFHKPIAKYNFLYSHGAKTVAIVYLAAAESRAEANRQRSLMEASGMHVALVDELPVATLSFDSAARAVANSKAEYMFFIGAAESNASMARALADTGYKLKYPEYFEFAYGGNFASAAGSASDGAITWLRTLPNDEAVANKEVAAFVRWMDETAPGIDKDSLTAESWVAAKVLVDGLTRLPGPITRDALVARLHAIDLYDADGMFGAIHLGTQLNQGCTIAVQVQSGSWHRLVPDHGFIC